MAPPQRRLEPTMVCVKHLIMGLNCLFVMTGMLLIAVGSAIKGMYSSYDEFFGSNLGSPASFLMAVGVIIFFVALFGCVGAMRESTCLINLYTISLIVIFIFEIAAAITGAAMQTTIRSTLGDNMQWNIQHKYLSTEDNISDTIDNIQESLECCGAYGVQDWEGVFTKDNLNYSPYLEFLLDDDIIVPDSCCGGWDVSHTNCTMPFTEGCLPVLTDVAQSGIMLLTGVAITMAAIQAMCIYFSNELTKAIRRAKSIRAMRQVEIRNNIASSYEAMDKQQVPTTPTPVVYLAASTDYTVA